MSARRMRGGIALAVDAIRKADHFTASSFFIPSTFSSRRTQTKSQTIALSY
jgi:hypothetical protein